MKKVFAVLMVALTLIGFIGCGLRIDSGDPSSTEIADTGDGNAVEMDGVSNKDPIELKVRLGWARAERFKVIGVKGYYSLFGIVRVEILSNRSQNVIIHYSTNGSEWFQVYSKDNGLTDDGDFKKFYFYTPSAVLDTNLVSKVVYQFRVEYQTEGETNVFSDSGRIFKASSNPGKSMPDGVIGQGAPGYWHILLENAEMIAMSNAAGLITNYMFRGNIQVKNDGPNLAKTVKVIYRTNTTGWNNLNVKKYPYCLAQNTGKYFYTNNSKFGIENWSFSMPMGTNARYIQFILEADYTTGTNMTWLDKNRCKRYWIKTIPGTMISYATN